MSLFPWKWVSGGLSAGLIVLALFAALCWHKWGVWKDAAELLGRQANTVVIALREASGNDDVDWSTATGQIRVLGESQRQLKQQIEIQNEKLSDLAKQAVAAKAEREKLMEIVDKAKAARRSAYVKLSQEAITPAEKADCLFLINDANDAINTAYEAGI